MASKYFYVNRYIGSNGTALRINAPIHVRTCGHYIVDKTFRDNYLKKDFLELFWCVRGSARIGFQGRVFLMQPRNVFFYLPGDFHDITAHSAPLEYYWMTLDGNNLDNLIEHFKLEQKIIQADICPINLFRQLAQHMEEHTIRGEYLAGAAAYHILSMAVAGQISEQPLFELFRELIQRGYNNPELTIEQIAQQLSVHRTTLTRCLKTVTGMTPGQYLLAFRMQEALSLIKNTTLQFKKIADEVGLPDQNYFAKVVRKQFGMSPSELRKNS